MSTIEKTVFIFLFAIVVTASPNVYGVPEHTEVVVRLEPTVWKIAVRLGKSDAPDPPGLTFVNTYADADRLARRISGLKAYDSLGNTVQMTPLGEGVYAASEPFSGFDYEIAASSPEPVIAAPHVSWAAKDGALIKLNDLLPGFQDKLLTISFELPKGWSVFTSEKQTGKMVFETNDCKNAVFIAGTAIRNETRQIADAKVSFAVSGKWQFDDSLLAQMTVEISAEYRKIFGSLPGAEFQVNLMRFPVEIGNDRWRAQTQARTITIVSSQSTYDNLASQRLHEQLRHELFHFWIPEGLQLSGDYAWFYEGFARYQSLKTGVWVGRIGFDDFLRSMSEAIYISSMDRSGLPLNELSRSIWLTGPGVVSAKGMSVAFYCDLLLLAKSAGRRSISNILKNLFGEYRGKQSENASEMIEKELNRYAELKGVVDLQINGTEPVNWSNSLLPFGLNAEQRNGRIVLSLASSPRGKAKALLNKLGYNRWKKYSPNS